MLSRLYESADGLEGEPVLGGYTVVICARPRCLMETLVADNGTLVSMLIPPVPACTADGDLS